MFPLVSIIIPCRNEEKFIGKCLDSIVSQNYPKEKLEVFVIDGASRDETKEIVQNYSRRYSCIKILDNPKRIAPVALNFGIKEAKGEIIMRMDAHATYDKNYISKCMEYLREYNADNIGGVLETLPSADTIFAKAVAIALSHPFGAGNSYFRTGSKKVREVDTVFGGCYKKEVFEKIGFFNENLIRSQDLEFNLRLKKSGGKILLAPEIKACYYPSSTLWGFAKRTFRDGIWAVYPLKFVKIPLRLRHYLPLIFVLTLPLNIWPYIPLSLFFSLEIAMKEKDIRLFFVMPLAFAVRHVSYGLGSILGLTKIISNF